MKGKKLVLRYRPLGLVGVIGPWNYPLTNSFGDCIPALAAGNAVILKPQRGHAADVLLLAEALRECGMPEDVLRSRHRRGDTGAALIDQVDMIMFTGSTAHRPQGHGAGGRDAHACVAGARRQGPDDRAGRRRPRARGQRRRLLLDVERRADVHLDRARLRRGAGLRRVRGQGDREGARLRQGAPGARAPSTWARSPSRRRSRSSSATSRTPATRARACWSAGSAAMRAAGCCYEPTVLVDVDHTMECMTRGDLRPDAADHEGRRRGGGHSAGQRLAVRPGRLGVLQGHRARRGGRAAHRGRRGLHQRCAGQLLGARVADGRREGQSGMGHRHGAGGIRKYTRRRRC